MHAVCLAVWVSAVERVEFAQLRWAPCVVTFGGNSRTEVLCCCVDSEGEAAAADTAYLAYLHKCT